MNSSSEISLFFKPLQENDLKLLCKWLDKPHVKEWWDDGLNQEEIKEKYRQRIGDETVMPFIVYLENNPIGFIQYYHANKVGDGWWPDELEGTVGIDQFIGEEKYINRGYGTQMIQKFIKKLFESPSIKKIITDVDPNNLRAINCYKKAGFKFVKELMTPDGLAFLMETKCSDMTIIREAKNEDTEALEEIFQITRQKTFKLTSSQNFNIGDYKKSTEGEEVWVAEESRNIAGFISLWLPDNFIHNLFVHPDCQGRSIGQQLLRKAEERLSRPMALKVTMDNVKACLFYEKHGWKKISVHENEQEPYILYKKN